MEQKNEELKVQFSKAVLFSYAALKKNAFEGIDSTIGDAANDYEAAVAFLDLVDSIPPERIDALYTVAVAQLNLSGLLGDGVTLDFGDLKGPERDTLYMDAINPLDEKQMDALPDKAGDLYDLLVSVEDMKDIFRDHEDEVQANKPDPAKAKAPKAKAAKAAAKPAAAPKPAAKPKAQQKPEAPAKREGHYSRVDAIYDVLKGGGGTETEVAAKSDKLFADKGGNSNVKEALRIFKTRGELAIKLGAIVLKGDKYTLGK
jgi:hypothetical protein